MGHGALHTLLSYLYCSSTGGCHTSESLCGPAGTPVAIPGSSQASVTLNGTNLDISMAGQSSSLAVPAGAQVSQCLPAKAICRLVAHVGQLAICSSHDSQQVSPSFAESGCALGAHRYLLLPVNDQTDSSPKRLGCIQAHQQSAGVTSAYAWHILRGSSLQSPKPLLQQMGTPSHLMTHPAGGGLLVRCDATAGSRFLSEKVKTFLSLQMEGTPPAAEPFQQSARYISSLPACCPCRWQSCRPLAASSSTLYQHVLSAFLQVGSLPVQHPHLTWLWSLAASPNTVSHHPAGGGLPVQHPVCHQCPDSHGHPAADRVQQRYQLPGHERQAPADCLHCQLHSAHGLH